MLIIKTRSPSLLPTSSLHTYLCPMMIYSWTSVLHQTYAITPQPLSDSFISHYITNSARIHFMLLRELKKINFRWPGQALVFSRTRYSAVKGVAGSRNCFSSIKFYMFIKDLSLLFNKHTWEWNLQVPQGPTHLPCVLFEFYFFKHQGNPGASLLLDKIKGEYQKINFGSHITNSFFSQHSWPWSVYKFFKGKLQ